MPVTLRDWPFSISWKTGTPPSLIYLPKYILLYFGSENEIWLAVPVFQEKLKGQSLQNHRPWEPDSQLPPGPPTIGQTVSFSHHQNTDLLCFGLENEIICPVVGFPGGSYGPILRIYDSGRLPLQLLLETWHPQPSLISPPKYILLYFGLENEIWLAVPVFQEKLKGQSLRVVRPWRDRTDYSVRVVQVSGYLLHSSLLFSLSQRQLCGNLFPTLRRCHPDSDNRLRVFRITLRLSHYRMTPSIGGLRMPTTTKPWSKIRI